MGWENLMIEPSYRFVPQRAGIRSDYPVVVGREWEDHRAQGDPFEGQISQLDDSVFFGGWDLTDEISARIGCGDG
jgi:hypothetical protein